MVSSSCGISSQRHLWQLSAVSANFFIQAAIQSHAIRSISGFFSADHTQATWGVDFHHSGDFLVSASMDHTARLWDLNSSKYACCAGETFVTASINNLFVFC